MNKTANFSVETDPKLACTCGHPKCDKREVKQAALNKIQLIRNDLGAPMIVTSGGRCPNHPDELHKKTVSDHQKCETVDIACDDLWSETKLKVLAGRHGATRVAGGAYCGFIHMCFSDEPDKSVPTWVY